MDSDCTGGRSAMQFNTASQNIIEKPYSREAAGRLFSGYKAWQSCPLYNIKMFDKERFHNALALSLGYERIVKDNRITIDVDDTDDPWVTLKLQSYPEVVRIKASGDADAAFVKKTPAMQNEIDYITDAVHQAFIQATTNPF